MIEAEEGRAVADRPAQGDRARRPERAVESQGPDAVAVAGHAVRVADVAAEDQPTQLTRRGPAGEPGGAVPEVEARADVGRLVRAAVPTAFPAGVGGERLDRALDLHVVEPQLTRRVGALRDRQHAEVVEGRPVGLVARGELAHRGLAVDRRGDRAAPAGGVRVVGQRPPVHGPLRREPAGLELAGLRVSSRGRTAAGRRRRPATGRWRIRR